MSGQLEVAVVSEQLEVAVVSGQLEVAGLYLGNLRL